MRYTRTSCLFVCMFVCLFVYVFVCLCVCLFVVCVFSCLFVCAFACLFVCFVCVFVCLFVCMQQRHTPHPSSCTAAPFLAPSLFTAACSALPKPPDYIHRNILSMHVIVQLCTQDSSAANPNDEGGGVGVSSVLWCVVESLRPRQTTQSVERPTPRTRWSPPQGVAPASPTSRGKSGHLEGPSTAPQGVGTAKRVWSVGEVYTTPRSPE